MNGTGRFVGRRSELDALLAAVTGAAPVVLVTGEAGIGKSRLVSELLGSLAARGHVTTTAGCLPLAEAVPLLPVADAISSLDGPGDRSLEHALCRLPDYVRIELSRLLPHLGNGGDPGGTAARRAFFSAVAALLAEVSAQGPMTVLLEDLQWADAATLDVLTYVIARLGGSAVTLVATCRCSDVTVPPHVQEWLTTVRHTPRTVEVRLGPLPRADAAEQVADLVGDVPDDGLVDEVYGRAEGNPFFTEHLLAPEPGDGPEPPRGPPRLPQGIAEELVARIRRPDDDARAVLAALAVAERPLTEQLIGRITGLGGDRLSQALQSLDRANLITRSGDADAYRVRRVLLAEAAAGDLLPGERTTLRGRVATALEDCGYSSLLAEATAGDLPHVASDLGGTGDPDGSSALLERARALAEQVSATTSDRDPLLWLAALESDVRLKQGRLRDAARVATEAATIARDSGGGDTFVGRLLIGKAAEAALEQGDVATAGGLVDPVTSRGPHGDVWITQAWRAAVDVRRGRVGDAVRRLDGVLLPVHGDVDLARELTQHVADAALWAGDPARALARVQRVVAELAGTQQDVLLGELLTLGARAAADLAVRFRARRETEGQSASAAALDALASLAAGMSRDPFEAHPFVVRGPADLATWHAERQRAAGVLAPEAWDEAAQAWEGLGRPHRAAYGWWRCAEAHLVVNGRSREAADAMCRAARRAAGHAPLLARLTTLAQRAHLPLDPEPPRVEPVPVIPEQRAYGLTERERVVLALVARGLTNAEIGARLYMSPKTASVHVTHIVRKMGVVNRIEAAAVAEHAGLLDSTRGL